MTEWSVADIEERVVRYSALRPCYNAFIDTRTPGSEAKENFTIIGPGVSENPEQHVHIAEPHGFNIGGARQPPGCVNSQHSHKTAEVFVAHSGHWRFDLGETGEDARVTMAPGDVISIPTDLFRGFTNVGGDAGFLWAVLGEDDPGRVLWAPQVFDLAREHGLVLMESGRLVDTTRGERPAADQAVMPPTTPEMVASLATVEPEAAETFVWRSGGASPGGADRLIGSDGYWQWPHGFTLTRLRVAQARTLDLGGGSEPRVLFLHEGAARLEWGDSSLALGRGDTVSLPTKLACRLRSDDDAVAFLVRGGERTTELA